MGLVMKVEVEGRPEKTEMELLVPVEVTESTGCGCCYWGWRRWWWVLDGELEVWLEACLGGLAEAVQWPRRGELWRWSLWRELWRRPWLELAMTTVPGLLSLTASGFSAGLDPATRAGP